MHEELLVEEPLGPTFSTLMASWGYLLKEPGIVQEDLTSQTQRGLRKHPNQWLSTLSAR